MSAGWKMVKAKRAGADGKLESYFRGRRLRGREVGVPRGYTGTVIREAVAEPRDQRRSSEPDAGSREGEGEEEEEVQDEMKSLESVASFEEMVIWGHEAVPEGDDAFVKGVEEWVGFAEAVSWVFPFFPSLGEAGLWLID